MKFSLRITKILSAAILAVLVGGVVFPAGVAFAQAPADPYKGYGIFGTLFQKDDSGNLSRINTVAPTAITGGAGFGAIGISAFKVAVDLTMDESRERGTNGQDQDFVRFHYYLTKDSDKDRFIAVIDYKDDAGTVLEEAVTPIPSSVGDSNNELRAAVQNQTEIGKLFFFADPSRYNGFINTVTGIFSFGIQDKQNRVMVTKQTAVTNVTFKKPVPYNAKTDVSFWYCAGTLKKSDPIMAAYLASPIVGAVTNALFGTSVVLDGTNSASTINNPDIARTFKDANGNALCGGTTYFKIAQMPYQVPASYQQAQTDAAAAQNIAAQANIKNDNALPACGLIGGNGTFMGCIALFVYHIFFRLAAFFAYLTGNIFDFFLGYSISSSAYSSSFITSGWETVRDIANIFFICLLIYVAIGSVFGIKGVSKKLVGTIIINAIFINFSLLITRGMIDISNITARVFYAQIHVENKAVVTNTIVAGGNAADVDYVGDSGYKSVSTIMLQSFDPQVVFDKALTQPPIPPRKKGEDQGAGSNTSFGAREGLSDIQNKSPEDYAGYFALVSLICAFIAFATGMIFWSIAFIFIGRVVGLYISMIFSPFAFMSRDIPFLKMLDKWHFDGWIKDLTSYMISAPLTVIYFYIVIKIMQTDFYASKIHGNAITATSFTATVLWITIPLIIIYGLLEKGKKMILSFSGEVGGMIQGAMNGIGKTLGGLTLGVAAGGTALALSKTVGKAASAADEGGVGRFARNLQTSKYFGWAGRGLSSGLKKTKEGSFDVRNTDTGKSMSKFFGADMNKGIKTDSTKGGYKGGVERDADKAVKQADYLKSQARTDEQKKAEMDAYNKKKNEKYKNSADKVEDEAKAAEYATKKAEYEAKKATHEAGIEAQMRADPTLTSADVDAMKADPDWVKKMKEYANKKGIVAPADMVDPGAAPKSRAHVNVETIDELDAARRNDYVQNLKEGGRAAGGLQLVFDAAVAAALTGGLPFIGGAMTAGIAAGFAGLNSDGLRDVFSSKDSESNQKAIKKLEEMGKASQKLDEVKQAINDGLKELIAIEKSKDPAFVAKSKTDQDADLAEALRQLKDDKKKYAEKIEIVEAMKKYEYDMKALQAEVKKERENIKKAKAKGDTAALITASEALESGLRELSKANKHQQTWNDVGKLRKEMQDKSKGQA